ncbi:MAG: 4-(cytidine 5'-diphospho)-2-C-methyl-D-erythritol kinase [Bdellovibrionales bacterium]|nr:4-(cytidine 5'-diphospho)-2-C-methyl-D-erythritol kinase [Bdellovibrionales bacterium]
MHLRVFEKMPNGFHRLQTLMVKLGLFDQMKILPSDNVQIDVMDHPEIAGKHNILHQTIERFQQATQTTFGLHVILQKNVPMGAGLGGGSANAARLLSYLQKTYAPHVSDEEMHELALSLGSDVPFFLLESDWAVLAGQGEEVVSVGTADTLWAVLCYPKISLHTGSMYQKLNRGLTWVGQGDKSPQSSHVQKWEEFRNVLPWVNDFEQVIDGPWLQAIKTKMHEQGSLFSQLSGSGSAVFGLFERHEDAKKACHALKDFGQVFAVSTDWGVGKW